MSNYNDRIKQLNETFLNFWLTSSPDFQNEVGYPKNEPCTANIAIGSKNIGYEFECLSMTVEMPFKDNNNLPDEKYGWSPKRSKKFGESLLMPILNIIDSL